MVKNNDYLVKAKDYLAAMKTMYNLEQLTDGVRPGHRGPLLPDEPFE